MEEKKEALYGRTDIKGYGQPVHVFGLDYYEPGAKGRHDFSRKEVWFYFFGDEELKDEFGERFENLLANLFIENSVDWDYITLVPDHEKDSLNSNMLELCQDASDNLDMDYRQVIRRSRSTENIEEMGSTQQKLVAIADSIEVTEDVEGENIILVDNVSVSGVTLSHCTEILLEAGAKRVCCIALGLTNHEREIERLAKGVTASAAMKREKV